MISFRLQEHAKSWSCAFRCNKHSYHKLQRTSFGFGQSVGQISRTPRVSALGVGVHIRSDFFFALHPLLAKMQLLSSVTFAIAALAAQVAAHGYVPYIRINGAQILGWDVNKGRYILLTRFYFFFHE